MTFRQFQPNFSRGELAPDLYGRFDVDAWNSAVKKARNVVILKYGGLTKRPGTRLVAEVIDDSEPTRIIPFQFSLSQTYALELGQGYMAPCASGGRVLEEELSITGITNANPAQVTAAYHGYAAGDLAYISGVAGDLGDYLNGRFWPVVASIDDSNFTIDANTSGMAAFTSATGGTTRSAPPTPPPAPPPVPDPVPAPPPPDTGGGWGGYCVADDTPILLAAGIEIPAGHIEPGMMLRTQHEETLEWGEFPVEAISFAEEPVFACTIGKVTIRATGAHRFWLDGQWVRAATIGTPDGTARVAKITVADAHTYVSDGVLSHNVKPVWFYG